jgi:hypothetical protein
MRTTVALPRISAFVFVASCVLSAQPQSTTAVSPLQTHAPAQQQPTNLGALTPTNEPVQQPTSKPQVREAGPQPTATPKVPQTPKQEAWQILDTACTGGKTSNRATAIRVLGLMPNDAKSPGRSGKSAG